jgi:hypothetical protein
MATDIKQYTLVDFDNIIFKGIEYTLPQDVLNTLLLLEKNMKQTTEEMSKKRTASSTQPKIIKSTDHTSTWKQPQPTPFKPTKIIDKEGTQEKMTTIRTALNKISKTNYEKQRDIIMSIIDEEMNIESIEKISNSIFDIASSNKFYSELYAELYRELIQKYEIFGDIIKQCVSQFTQSIDSIQYVDPKNDDTIYLKKNDLRKATTSFIVKMMEKEVITKDIFMDIIEYFQKFIIENIEREGRLNEVQEIVENVFIMISTSGSLLSQEDRFVQTISETIHSISNMKVKEHASLSNRIVFKYNDMVQLIKHT